jgi:hypothetical protein
MTVTGAAARRRRSIGRWLRQNSSRSPTSAPGRRRFATVVVPEHVHQLRMVLVVDKREAQVSSLEGSRSATDNCVAGSR